MATNTNISTHGLPSPITSVHSPVPSDASTTGGRTGLPTPRTRPLKPGSPKQVALIGHIDAKLRRVERRYGKKYVEPVSSEDEAPGYTGIDQVIEDLEPLIDLAWMSGTPVIQISYLLSLAGYIMSYMPAFPFSSDVFRITKKLDTAFASLIRGDSGEAIRARPVSTTQKVRIRSLVQETRVVAVNVASANGIAAETEKVSDEEDDDDDDDEDIENEDESEDEDGMSTALEISRMYQSTMEILGADLVAAS